MMSPFDYAQIYWNLPVPLINAAGEVTSWELFRINKYRLANRISDDPETYDADTTAALSEYANKVKPFADKETKEVKVFTKNDDGSVNEQIFTRVQENKLLGIAKRAIWGKGSPEECQITLQLAYRFGLAPTAQELQKYVADGKIGLDCNGFVGNYMQRVLGKKVDSTTRIDDLLQAGRPVKSFDEMTNVNLYVLGMVDDNGNVIGRVVNGKHGHIMITTFSPYTDTVGVVFNGPNHTNPGKVSKSVQVLESTGGRGLVESTYLLLDEEKKNGVNTGVFKVYRGSKDVEMPVRITRVYT